MFAQKKDAEKEQGMYAVEKPHLRCHKCSMMYHYRVPKNWLLRNVLFFLPIKVFFCARCLKNRYVFLTDREESKYQPV